MSAKKSKTPTCPICGEKPPSDRFRPFCSARCADVDLHRWLGGVYAVPAEETAANDDGEKDAD